MNVLIREENIDDIKDIESVIKSDKYRECKDKNYNEWNLDYRIRNNDYYIKPLCLIAEVDKK